MTFSLGLSAYAEMIGTAETLRGLPRGQDVLARGIEKNREQVRATLVANGVPPEAAAARAAALTAAEAERLARLMEQEPSGQAEAAGLP